MIFKYIVPEEYRKIYDNKKIIYCRVLKKVETDNDTLYLIRMINYKKRSNVYSQRELKKLNILDKIKVKFIR